MLEVDIGPAVARDQIAEPERSVIGIHERTQPAIDFGHQLLDLASELVLHRNHPEEDGITADDPTRGRVHHAADIVVDGLRDAVDIDQSL